MLTLNQIAEIIRQNDAPYLSLQVKDTFRASQAGRFNCETCNEKNKIEKAIEWLDSYTALFDDDTVFIITAKPSPTANGSSVIGPLIFTRTEKESQTPQMQGLGAIHPQKLQELGYIPKAQLEAEIIKKEMEFLRHKFKTELERMKEQYQHAVDTVIQTSNSWTPDKVNRLIDNAVMGYLKLTGKAPTQQPQELAGIPAQNNLPPAKQKLITEIQNLDDKQTLILLKTIQKLKTIRDAGTTETQEVPSTAENSTHTVPADITE